MDEKEFIELLRKIGNCDDKEQMQRVIDEHNKSQQSFTNADRIRAMSDEELAEVLGKLVHCGGCPMRDNCKVDDLPCNNVLIEWLKQPAEGE